MMYCVVNETAIEDVGRMDSTMWENVVTHKPTDEYNSVKNNSPTAGSTPTTSTTGNSSAVHNSSFTSGFVDNLPPARTTSKDVLCINFLKYTEVKLQDKDDILMFYRNIYNTKLEQISNVPNATVHVELKDTSVINITGDILYQKFRQTDVISDSYETAHNLLDTTTNGYESLLLLLRQFHTKLLIRPSATVDIPQFSTYKCVYKHGNGLKDYKRQQDLANCEFDNLELYTMFLDNLNHICFTAIKTSITNIIRTSSKIALEYLVPALESTVNQLVTIHPSIWSKYIKQFQ